MRTSLRKNRNRNVGSYRIYILYSGRFRVNRRKSVIINSRNQTINNMATAKKQEQKVDKRSKAYRDAQKLSKGRSLVMKQKHYETAKKVIEHDITLPDSTKESYKDHSTLIKELQETLQICNQQFKELLNRIAQLETKVG